MPEVLIAVTRIDRELVDAEVSPEGGLEVLSQSEVNRLRDATEGGLYERVRRCALAVLNTGSTTDDSHQVFEQHKDFRIRVLQRDRGIKLQLEKAPASAFVDGEMIRGIREHLFAVLRDIVYVNTEIEHARWLDLDGSAGITNAIFHILRNARTLVPNRDPNLVVGWGGHAIGRVEYQYSKEVGYELGLRGMDICTGCGPGAMKGPMKGATIAHAKQRIRDGRYIGVTEPGIIAAEAPNPIVNELVIMPDIEKRLEAFLRIGHGIVIFPGGVGTAEELLYLLGVLMHADNARLPFPVILTAPRESADYWHGIDAFVGRILGEQARRLYRIVIDDPARVAREMRTGVREVRAHRREHKDAFFFNWLLRVPEAFQRPFTPTHASMRGLYLGADQAPHELAANLRRAMSGIVAGNVKDEGIRAIEQHGHFELHGDRATLQNLDDLLAGFAEQGRMTLSGSYNPCYRLIA